MSVDYDGSLNNVGQREEVDLYAVLGSIPLCEWLHRKKQAHLRVLNNKENDNGNSPVGKSSQWFPFIDTSSIIVCGYKLCKVKTHY